MTNHTLSRPRDGQPALLEDIKRQARRLFKDVQSGHLLDLERKEDFRLTRALELVARSHGFDTWGQLNAHLRMSDALTGHAPGMAHMHTNPASSIQHQAAPLLAGAGRPPRKAWGLSEVEFAQRLAWHCAEGTLAASAEDYEPMLWVLQRLLDANALGQEATVTERLRPKKLSAEEFDRKSPLGKVKEAEQAYTEAHVRYMNGRLSMFGDTLQSASGFDADLHLPALSLLIEFVDSGTLAARPNRKVVAYQGGMPATSVEVGSAWKILHEHSSNPVREDHLQGSLAFFNGFESCPHAVIFAPSQEDRQDFFLPALVRLKEGRHSLLPLDLYPYEKHETDAHRQIYYREPWLTLYKTDTVRGADEVRFAKSLRIHTDMEPDTAYVDPVDLLLHNHDRAESRRIGVRAPLVVSVKWHPHDAYLPVKLPDLRKDNIFVVSLVTPGNYTPAELQRLKTLMDNSGWWVLAPGADLPPVEGIERVRNDDGRTLMMRRE
jgi:hypothetical protein